MVLEKNLLRDLRSFGHVYLDTNLLVYHLEDILPYSNLTQLIFERIAQRRFEGHTSVLGILELNVKPYQQQEGRRAVLQTAFLKNFPNFSIHPLTLEMAQKAAQLRADYGLKTPDAIHAACALSHSCNALIGNDDKFRRVKEIAYLHLDDFI